MTTNISTTEQEETTTPSTDAPSLSLQDLIVMAQIIQLSSGRGSFRAEELETVGSLYTKLVTFLEANGAVNRVNPEDETESTESSSEVTE